MVAIHDLAKEPPTRDLLEGIIGIDATHIEQVLNTRSPRYKELNLGDKKLNRKEAIDLMLREPILIRRPLLVRGDRALFGFDAERYSEFLKEAE